MTIEQGARPPSNGLPSENSPRVQQWNRSIFTRPDTRRPHRTSMLIPAPRAGHLPGRSRSSPPAIARNAASCCPAATSASVHRGHRFPVLHRARSWRADIGVFIGRCGPFSRRSPFESHRRCPSTNDRLEPADMRRQGPNDGPPEAADPSSPISFGYGRYPAVVGLGLKGASQPRVDARRRYPSAPARAWVKDPIRPAPGHSTWACVSALHMHRVNLSITDSTDHLGMRNPIIHRDGLQVFEYPPRCQEGDPRHPRNQVSGTEFPSMVSGRTARCLAADDRARSTPSPARTGLVPSCRHRICPISERKADRNGLLSCSAVSMSRIDSRPAMRMILDLTPRATSESDERAGPKAGASWRHRAARSPAGSAPGPSADSPGIRPPWSRAEAAVGSPPPPGRGVGRATIRQAVPAGRMRRAFWTPCHFSPGASEIAPDSRWAIGPFGVMSVGPGQDLLHGKGGRAWMFRIPRRSASRRTSEAPPAVLAGLGTVALFTLRQSSPGDSGMAPD